MDIFKFGVIGLIILLPFLFINVITGDTYRYRERSSDYVRDQLEGASMDAAFAMKTYSEGGYNSNDVYSIRVPLESVTETFFTSLKFREFSYGPEDFPALIIMGYNQVIIYKPASGTYSRPYYYMDDSGRLYTMGDETYTMVDGQIHQEGIVNENSNPNDDGSVNENGSVNTEEDLEEDARRSRAIYDTLQEAVAYELPSYSIQTGIYEDSFGTAVADDLSIIALYDGASDYGLGQAVMQTFTPSGIMKSEINY